MRIFGLMVTKDEAQRYLQCNLRWHRPVLDGLLVYDDRSLDCTAAVGMDENCVVYRRDPKVPSFMQHEGAFRDDSFVALDMAFNPFDGDWVLSIDADEFLVAHHGGDLRQAMETAIARAQMTGAPAVTMNRPELWALDPARERTDGFWGSIRCSRLFQWHSLSEARVKDRPMGCGSEPTYVEMGPHYHDPTLRLLHLGYVDADDRKEKYSRYAGMGSSHGHNQAHIDSILADPALQEYAGPMPDIWRGLVE